MSRVGGEGSSEVRGWPSSRDTCQEEGTLAGCGLPSDDTVTSRQRQELAVLIPIPVVFITVKIQRDAVILR